MNAVIACGGTGGHLFPGLAVAEVLRARGHEVHALHFRKGNRHPRAFRPFGVSLRKTADGWAAVAVLARDFPFHPALQREPVASAGVYRSFNPHVVLGMGGFTSTAPILAGRMRDIPTFIHESNAIPGKANRLTARMVRAVLLGFKECAQFFPKVRTEITGTPIRAELQTHRSRGCAAETRACAKICARCS